jgi:peroxiredoxin
MGLGEKIFEFSLPNLQGQPVSIQDYRGKKVLIFMWASW